MQTRSLLHIFFLVSGGMFVANGLTHADTLSTPKICLFVAIGLTLLCISYWVKPKNKTTG